MTGLLGAVERTALLTAALRAAESGRPDRLFADPYAEMLSGGVGPELLAEVRAATFPKTGSRTLPSTPDYNAIRTRFFDDLLREILPGTQVVLAPAGMDSRAYRLEWPAGVRFFELDRPAVLDFKRSRLGDVPLLLHHRAVPVDLTSPDWTGALCDSGYDPALRSVWLLEGLLYYLAEPDVDRVLERVVSVTAPGSTIIGDLVNADALELPHMRGLLEVFARWGCPWIFGTNEPEALFDRHGITARAVQPGEPGAGYGRWPDPVPPRDRTGVSRVFFVHGWRR